MVLLSFSSSLKEVVGPDSTYGRTLIPMFFKAIIDADAGDTSKENCFTPSGNVFLVKSLVFNLMG